MKIIGLTGQSGAGKGTVAAILKDHGIPHIDCDKVYHSLLGSDSECTKALCEAFGDQILNDKNEVDRKKLGSIVFSGNGHEKRLEILNGITHRFVLNECRKMLKKYEADGAKSVAVDAPTLFESGFYRECDIILAVVAPEEKRLRRIIRRDEISQEKAKERFNAQKDESFFREHADYIIDNSSDMDDLISKVEKFVREKLS